MATGRVPYAVVMWYPPKFCSRVKKKSLYFGIFGVFVLYWGMTLLYCMPTNPVRIELHGYMEAFGKLFYQRWTFFTPPPKTNERVFFQYMNVRDTTDRFTVEVLGEINAGRKKNPVFNVSQEVLENIVLRHSYNLNNILAAHHQSLKKAFPDSSERFLAIEMTRLMTGPATELPSFRTLRNYASIVLAEHKQSGGTYKCRIIMASMPIVPFRHRYDSNYKTVESILFETPLMHLPVL